MSAKNIFSDKLLKYAFTRAEIKFLLANEEFVRRGNDLKNVFEFERLCVFGFELLNKESGSLSNNAPPRFEGLLDECHSCNGLGAL